jgi:hypothetical protein
MPRGSFVFTSIASVTPYVTCQSESKFISNFLKKGWSHTVTCILLSVHYISWSCKFLFSTFFVIKYKDIFLLSALRLISHLNAWAIDENQGQWITTNACIVVFLSWSRDVLNTWSSTPTSTRNENMIFHYDRGLRRIDRTLLPWSRTNP